jgi:hypothetical protein
MTRVMLVVATALVALVDPVIAQERLAHELGEFEFLPTSTSLPRPTARTTSTREP